MEMHSSALPPGRRSGEFSFFNMKHKPSRHCLVLWARLKSFGRIDTRVAEIYSAIAKIVWAVGFLCLPTYSAHSSYGRVELYLHPGWFSCLLIPFALFHIVAILLNHGRLRRVCIMVGVAWWSGLSLFMVQFPPNYAASTIYGQMALFGIWAYVAARLRGEVGK